MEAGSYASADDWVRTELPRLTAELDELIGRHHPQRAHFVAELERIAREAFDRVQAKVAIKH